jgi:hypothetical protein
MYAVFVRLLVIVMSVLLALPPGWCCMLRVLASPEIAQEDSSECCECDHCTNHHAPQRKHHKMPLSQGECPCTQRLSTPLPGSPLTFADCVAPDYLMAWIVEEPVLTRSVDQVDPLSFDSAHALHLRCCVWRC